MVIAWVADAGVDAALSLQAGEQDEWGEGHSHSTATLAWRTGCQPRPHHSHSCRRRQRGEISILNLRHLLST